MLIIKLFSSQSKMGALNLDVKDTEIVPVKNMEKVTFGIEDHKNFILTRCFKISVSGNALLDIKMRCKNCFTMHVL